jgi:hypothetical protein
MSATARAMLGSLKIADNVVSASYEGVFDTDRERKIVERAVAQVMLEGQRRVSPITLVSSHDSVLPPLRRYISLDLEDYQ